MWTKRKWWKKYRWLVIVSGVALLAGGILAWWWHVPGPPETALTDHSITDGRRELEDFSRRVDQIAEQVKKEVTSIRATVKSAVQALPPDGVARGLNNELERFRRGVDARPPGMAEQ